MLLEVFMSKELVFKRLSNYDSNFCRLGSPSNFCVRSGASYFECLRFSSKGGYIKMIYFCLKSLNLTDANHAFCDTSYLLV